MKLLNAALANLDETNVKLLDLDKPQERISLILKKERAKLLGK